MKGDTLKSLTTGEPRDEGDAARHTTRPSDNSVADATLSAAALAEAAARHHTDRSVILAGAVAVVTHRYGHPQVGIDGLPGAPGVPGAPGLVLAPRLDMTIPALLTSARALDDVEAGGPPDLVVSIAADHGPPADDLDPSRLTVGYDDEWIRLTTGADLFPVPHGRLLGHIGSVLHALADPDIETVGDIDLLTQDEHAELDEWNRTEVDFPPLTLAQAVAAQAGRTPDAPAFVDDHRTVSYAELDRRTDAMGAVLAERGIGPEAIVGLITGRSIDAGLAIIAAYKAGAAYAPLDGAQPPARLARALTQVEPDLLVVEATHRAVVDEALAELAPAPTKQHPEIIELETLLAAEVIEGGGTRPPVSGQLDHLAYALTTSGSTGVPKAALIDQRGLMNHAWAMIDALGIDERTVLAQNAPLSFDISVWQILTPLLVGGQVSFAPEEARSQPEALFAWLHRHDVTILQLVPSLMATVLAVGGVDEADGALTLPPSLRWLIPTGEALPPDVARRWLSRFPGVPLVNAYGPAECADDVTLHVITSPPTPDETVMPIGRPVANVTVDVVDEAGHRAPVGIVGELVVGGVGVGRGYRNDPERTDAAFGPDPRRPGGRCYRTGDLGFRRPDGVLVYEGRIDHQVKVNGRRIELGEIEAALIDRPEIDGAVVGVEGDHLVAWVTSSAAGGPPDVDRQALGQGLGRSLPPYLVPTRLVVLDHFPLSANGKIDRRSLPPSGPGDLLQRSSAREEPVTATEHALAAIWRDVLGVDPGRHDSFFDLGGSSLSAAVLLFEINKRLGADLPLPAPINAPTLSALAAVIDDVANGPEVPGLIELQPAGDRTPVFLAPGQGGSVLGFLPLSRLVGDDQPLFGIDLQRRRSEPSPPQTFDAIAERHFQTIKAQYPEGPYVVGGFCMGGDVALALARRLRAEGDEVPLVVMLQTEHPRYPQPRPGTTRLGRLVASIRDRLRYEADTTRSLPAGDRRRYVVDDLGARILAKGTVRLERLGARLGLVGNARRPGSEAFQRDRWAQADANAYREYEPAPYDGEVLVVSATRQPAGAEPDPSLGWSEVVTGRLRVAAVEGWHWNFLRPPQITTVAEVVREALDEVTTQRPATDLAATSRNSDPSNKR